jgi:hypothetical protein
MTAIDRCNAGRARLVSILASILLVAMGAMPASAITDGDPPFAKLAGRWTGEGMLGFKASPSEHVKCRATYFLNDAKDELKQTIRCATSGGNVEVLSNIKNSGGTLSGHWQETTRNFSGDLKGEITPKGLRISVQGSDLNANMDIVVKDDRQLVEIQFVNTSLVGLTLLMKKG